METLQSDGELLEAKINALNNKTTLTTEEIETLDQYNTDLQKKAVQLFAAADKVNSIYSAVSVVENALLQAEEFVAN